jgi:hypothetical protein
MKMIRLGLALVAAGAISIGSTYASDGGPLVEALVKKGVLSAQEGEEVRMEMQEAYMGTDGGMLNWGSSAVKGVKLYGDVRMRYQWEDAASNGGSGDRERQRLRYRLRIGADYQFSDNFRAGIRLETANGNNSTNVTFGDGGNAPFSKNADGVGVGLAYLTYENDDIFDAGFADNFVVTIGKMKNGFMIDKAFWDGDINPEGAFQEIGWNGVLHDDLDLTFRAGQFIMTGDDREGGARNTATGRDKHHGMYLAQMEAKFNNFTVAPLFLYASGVPSGIGTNANAQETFTTLMVPMAYKFKAFGQSHALKAAYGINFSAESSNNGGNGQLAQIGYQLGSAKKKGSWQVGGDFRYIEEDSMPAYLTDSDFYSVGGGQVGAYGYKLGAKYAVTDNITTAVTWIHSFATEQDDPFGFQEEQLVQVDLAWKF